MRNLIALLAFLALLAGCGQENAAQSTEQVESPVLESTTPQSPIERSGLDAIDETLANLEKVARISIRYDRERALKNDETERQVFVEMLGASADETEAFATRILGDAGFSARKGMVDEDGIRIQYRRDDVEPLNVLIRSKAGGPPLKDADATSSFYVRQLQK